ncbi:MBL fold metallo-hydrolase [Limnoglobus roseus]|uniref:Ribonuclease Z n=1 Tax=Limnoglobus roseus TaxID=2598579 RepID=A0A5C1A8T2_9BACT|nr:MBL fold metallo-hydrolase [Limnoglobus roseus]QEL14426.1 ribonuclease Z [Limnoglobus roseus]
MAIEFQVLGGAGEDNAAFVRVTTGQAIHRLLFDCGEGCPGAVPNAELLQLDHLCFSHFHMDHVAGFDSLFRRVYDRETKRNCVWGPPGTRAVLHHRLQGFLWNLVAGKHVPWFVHDIHPDGVQVERFELSEQFATAHPEAGQGRTSELLFSHPDYSLSAFTMNHGTPSMAYLVREVDRVNVNTDRMAARGWKPGPWLKRVRGTPAGPGEVVEVSGTAHSLAEVQAELLTLTSGDSLAYLTDFRMDGPAVDYLVERLRGVGTIICESQYRPADVDLAVANKHMVATEAATLAARCGARQLVLFHVSDRYPPHEWGDMLREAKAVFPRTEFPPHWGRF